MDKIFDTPLEEELQTSYVDYAMSVIIGRAIPDARDGLKPVQRRILYGMYNLSNTHDQPTKKSARIVGEVMGKLHPHGDMAIYDALVRMAQPFSLNHTFVEGQGNFGSVDGDPPAHMRYTEVRLTKIAENMLDDLEKDTVNFLPNFDNTEKEPAILPAMIPNLLVNGASGIAVGVATSMPPHNLGEVCDGIIKMLENGDVTSDEMTNIIKGPDFPTGGTVIMSTNAYNGYKYGRGQVTIKATIEVDAKKNRLTITEIPYNSNKSSIIENIAQLVRDKKLVGISDLRDESDKEGISIVVDLKKDVNPDSVINGLYKHTQLEVTFPIINLAVVGNNLRTFNVLQLLKTFLDHRRDVIRKRSTFELNVAKDRLHIVEGLRITIDKIEEVVKLIRNSDEAKGAREALMRTYTLSEKQANAILDMKLSKLTHLEAETLDKEGLELKTKIIHFTGILEDPKKVDDIIKVETLAIKKAYARDRVTKIIKGEDSEDILEEDMISNEMETIILTSSGYVKRLDPSNYKEQGRGGRGVIVINLKEKDFVKQILTGFTKDYLICISDKGQAYWLKIYKIPEGSRYAEGKAIVNLLDIKDEKIITLFGIKDFQHSQLLFMTKKGLIKKVHASLFSKPRSNGIRAITINKDDEVVNATTYTNDKYVLIFTKKGKAIKFEESDLRFIGRTAMGVRGIRLKNGDVAEGIIAGDNAGYVLTVTERGFGKLTDIGKYRLQRRGGGGIINVKISDKTGDVAKVLFIPGGSLENKNAVLVNSQGVAITIPLNSVRITGRAAKGVHLMKLESGARIVDVRIIDKLDAAEHVL